MPGQIEFKPEGAADADLAAQSELPSHQFHQLPRDGGTEAGATIAPRGAVIGLRKTFEYLVLDFRGNPDAGVFHFKAQQHERAGIGRTFDAQRDPSTVGKLDRVRHQIDQHLAQVIRIAAQRKRDRRIDLHRQLQIARAGLPAKNIDGAVQQAIQVEINLFNR